MGLQIVRLIGLRSERLSSESTASCEENNAPIETLVVGDGNSHFRLGTDVKCFMKLIVGPLFFFAS